MIYAVTFNQLYPKLIHGWCINKVAPKWPYIPEMVNKHYDPSEDVAEAIKTLEDNTFVFIIQKKQVDKFNEWLDKHGLREYIVYQMPTWVTNQVHEYNGRNLKLVVLANKTHFWREMYPETEEDFYLEEIKV